MSTPLKFDHVKKFDPATFKDAYTLRVHELPKIGTVPIDPLQLTVENMKGYTFYLQTKISLTDTIRLELDVRKDCNTELWKNVTLYFQVNGTSSRSSGVNRSWKKEVKISDFRTQSSIPIVSESYALKRNFNHSEMVDDLILTVDVTQIFPEYQSTRKHGCSKCNKRKEEKPFCAETLFILREFADITIKVDDTIFKAHKCILANRSAVFRAMLNSKMKESETNEIIINDVTPECFDEFLFFIYSGRVRRPECATLELAIVADQYELLQLMRMCEFYQERHISVETAWDLFRYAELKNRQKLCQVAVGFIVENKNKFQEDQLKLIYKDPHFCEALLSFTEKKLQSPAKKIKLAEV